MIITLRQLKLLGACKEQVQKFKDTFGPEVKVTEALCIKHAKDFDWNWAAFFLLPKDDLKTYEEAVISAWKAYEKAVALVGTAYPEAVAPAMEVYKKAQASAFGKLFGGNWYG